MVLLNQVHRVQYTKRTGFASRGIYPYGTQGYAKLVEAAFGRRIWRFAFNEDDLDTPGSFVEIPLADLEIVS